MQLNTLYNIIYRHLRGKTRLKRIGAIVVGAVENTNGTKFKVTYINNNNDEVCIQLVNKSKDELSEGDHVWIHYWNSVTDGYIALKNGLSSFGITPPIKARTKVINSYQFTKSNNIVSNNYSYSISRQTSQSERIEFAYGTPTFDRFVYSPEIWETGRAALYHVVWYYALTLYNDVAISLTNPPYEDVNEGVNRLRYIYNAIRYTDITLPYIRTNNNNQAYIEEYNYSIQLDSSSLRYQIIETDQNSNTRVCYTYPGGYSNDSVAFVLESSLSGLDWSTMWNTDFENGLHGINGISIDIRPVYSLYGTWQRINSLDSSWRYGYIDIASSRTYPVALPRISNNVPSQKCIVTQTSTTV